MRHAVRTTTIAALPLLAAALSACGGGHRLADYDFSGRSVAVTHFPTPAPLLRTGGYDVDADDEDGALMTVILAGSRIAREVEARRARSRLDSAATRVDITSRVADRTLQRGSRYLGARPVAEEADPDYLLEVDVWSLGIDVRSDNAFVFVSGEVVLLDRRTGSEIWHSEVRRYDPLTPDAGDTGPVPSDIVTAGALGSMSVADFERILERLADHTADVMANELRSDLRDVRRR
jgi:hypothetical protein